MPDDNPQFNSAWKHLTDTLSCRKFWFRTNEPSYEYYFKQFVYFEGKREVNGTAELALSKQPGTYSHGEFA
jgi:hypothetical protein